MALDIQGILDVICSHALSTGYFESVNQHESKQSPGNGISASVWVDRVFPIRSSGLASTTIRLDFLFRMYSSTYTQPYDDVDPNLVKALDAVMSAYCGNLEIDGLSRNIDLFGAHGTPVECRSGFMNLDGKEFRAFTIRLPLVINDLWAQSS